MPGVLTREEGGPGVLMCINSHAGVRFYPVRRSKGHVRGLDREGHLQWLNVLEGSGYSEAVSLKAGF